MNSYILRSLALALLAVVAVLACLPGMATTYYVRQGGSDQADGVSPATAFKSVLSAVQSLNHGDTIVIGPGSYTTSSLLADRYGTIENRITVLGDESGVRTGDAPGPVIIKAPSSSDIALEFSRVTRLTVSGLTFQGIGQGIKLTKCIDVRIERCTFAQLTRGLVSEGVQGLRVESCVFSRCVIGLFLHGTHETRLAHNTIAASSSTGVLLLACGPGAIRNSLFAANNVNYVADAIAAPSWSSDYNVIRGPTGPWGDVPSAFNISEWFPASGQERHSIFVTPSFFDAEKYDLHIAPEVTWGGGLPGMSVGTTLEPKVAMDRDGRPYRTASAGAFDYPDPVPAPGWQKLPVSLAAPNSGPRQSAGLYRADGTLVRMLLADVAGVHDLWWNGLDDNGQPVGIGTFQARSITHDVRLLDDGGLGDNGTLQGAFNCDNADHALALPDGSFLVTTVYDEAGYVLRRYSPSGQPTFAANLTESAFWGMAMSGNELIGGTGKGSDVKLIRLSLPGKRILMENGAEFYRVFDVGEENATPLGLAVAGGKAYLALGGVNVVRVIELASGKKLVDWPMPALGDIVADAQDTVWAISGTDVVAVTAAGQVRQRYPSGLMTPRYLAVSPTRLAVIDRKASRIALLDSANGSILRTIGKDRSQEYWMPVSTEAFRDPRGAAFLPDGKLLLTEHSRVRAFWPETGKEAFTAVSNFMETAVTHPTQPEYVYCGLGIFHVDATTSAWRWLVETPTMNYYLTKEEDPWNGKRLGSPGQSVVLAGRPFIAYYSSGKFIMFDVSEPLKPRKALEYSGTPFNPWAYATVCFSTDGDIIAGGNYRLLFNKIKFTGLDEQQNPIYDFTAPITIGMADDPETARGMKSIEALTSDRSTGDIYYLAISASHKKWCLPGVPMAQGWGNHRLMARPSGSP